MQRILPRLAEHFAEQSWTLESPIDLRLTLSGLMTGGRDPTTRFDPRGFWRTFRSPEGPATLNLLSVGKQLNAKAWGPGADWALERVPHIVGLDDPPVFFDRSVPLLGDLSRKLPGMKLGGAATVLEVLLPIILQQRVTYMEAARSYQRMVRKFSDPAPGEMGLFLPPDPKVFSKIPYHVFRQYEVDQKRWMAFKYVCQSARRFEAMFEMPFDKAHDRMCAVPNIGPWTAGFVMHLALKDPDAVPIGDLHIPNTIAYVFAREPRATDERMLEILEPYRGRRGWVLKLVNASGMRAPRYGPKRPAAVWYTRRRS